MNKNINVLKYKHQTDIGIVSFRNSEDSVEISHFGLFIKWDKTVVNGLLTA